MLDENARGSGQFRQAPLVGLWVECSIQVDSLGLVFVALPPLPPPALVVKQAIAAIAVLQHV